MISDREAPAISTHRTHLAAASREGLPAERCAELNRLLNIVHNLPKFLEGTHSPGFDQNWFLEALQAFDEKNGTDLATRYTARLESASVEGTA
jgi:hypothetical protein